jgi:hypothetical protein
VIAPGLEALVDTIMVGVEYYSGQSVDQVQCDLMVSLILLSVELSFCSSVVGAGCDAVTAAAML